VFDGWLTLNFQALVWSALVVALMWAAMELWGRWRRRRLLKRVLAEWRRDQEHGRVSRPRLPLESQCVVTLSESAIYCVAPNETMENMAWADLQKVEILTTDHGPFAPDVFWVLHGSETRCTVPQGATGEAELRERIQQLLGFRNEAAIEAMSSTDHRRFLCWEKAWSAGQISATDP
jgi:hypothetical protein